MSTNNGISTPQASTVFTPPLDTTESLMDYSSDAYLQRGAVLDKEVRDLVKQIEDSNAYLNEINALLAKANTVLYDTDNYSATTWQTNFSGADKTITLENNYAVKITSTGDVVITDSEGNELTASAGVLSTKDSDGNAGISTPINGNTTILLEDGTKITLNMAGSAVADVVITRGNQGVTVNAVNGTPTLDGPNLNGETTDTNTNDGDIYVENGSVNTLMSDGTDITHYDTSLGVLTSEHKTFINQQLNIGLDLSGNLSEDIWKELKSELTLVRDNLTGSNQLLVVQMQSSLTRYNQNYDSMSNSQNKIYSIIKDILSNIK